MIVLSNKDVATLLPMETAVAVVERAMVAVSAGKATLPLRSIIDVGGPNKMGMMPGAMTDPACYGIKLVSLFPGNPEAGYSSHQGAIVLFESGHGSAVAMMNAGLLTAIRTAAASAVATRALAREDAKVLAIVGTGEQAEHHLDAMLAVRDITEVRVAGRRQEKADAFVPRRKATLSRPFLRRRHGHRGRRRRRRYRLHRHRGGRTRALRRLDRTGHPSQRRRRRPSPPSARSTRPSSPSPRSTSTTGPRPSPRRAK